MADYVLEGPYWGAGTGAAGGGTITWSVDATVPASFLNVISAAFADWTDHANIKFQQVAAGSSAKITFTDSYIDGPNNTLGYTSYYYMGQSFTSAQIKFDSGENWKQSGSQVLSSSGANLFIVALHEIGHAIGLDHYNASPAVMNSILSSSVTDLTVSDIHGVQALYGAPAQSSVLADAYGTAIQSTVTPAGQVYALYEGLLGRVPDYAGLTTWVNALNGGTSLRDVTAAILASPEAKLHINAGDNAGFVEQLYETVLGRHGDASGGAAWTSQLNNGTSRADVADSFVFSSEHVASLQPALTAGVFVPDPHALDVARLYYTLLDRAPDGTGLQSFTSAVENGSTSLHDIAQAMLGAPEYGTLTGTLSDGTYVQNLYQQLLGRQADAGGLQSFTDALAHGASRASIAQAFVTSTEFQASHAGQTNGAYIESLYEQALGRHGDTAGLQTWTAALDNHTASRTDLGSIFVTSAEFQTHLPQLGGGLSDSAFVDSLYENALGRHADPAGLQTFTTALAHATSRADVALAIAQSPEAHQHLASQIEQGWHVA